MFRYGAAGEANTPPRARLVGATAGMPGAALERTVRISSSGIVFGSGTTYGSGTAYSGATYSGATYSGAEPSASMNSGGLPPLLRVGSGSAMQAPVSSDACVTYTHHHQQQQHQQQLYQQKVGSGSAMQQMKAPVSSDACAAYTHHHQQHYQQQGGGGSAREHGRQRLMSEPGPQLSQGHPSLGFALRHVPCARSNLGVGAVGGACEGAAAEMRAQRVEACVAGPGAQLSAPGSLEALEPLLALQLPPLEAQPSASPPCAALPQRVIRVGRVLSVQHGGRGLVVTESRQERHARRSTSCDAGGDDDGGGSGGGGGGGEGSCTPPQPAPPRRAAVPSDPGPMGDTASGAPRSRPSSLRSDENAEPAWLSGNPASAPLRGFADRRQLSVTVHTPSAVFRLPGDHAPPPAAVHTPRRAALPVDDAPSPPLRRLAPLLPSPSPSPHCDRVSAGDAAPGSPPAAPPHDKLQPIEALAPSTQKRASLPAGFKCQGELESEAAEVVLSRQAAASTGPRRFSFLLGGRLPGALSGGGGAEGAGAAGEDAASGAPQPSRLTKWLQKGYSIGSHGGHAKPA